MKIITNALTKEIFVKYKDQVVAGSPFQLWSAIKAAKGVVVQRGIGLTNIRNKFLAEE